MTPQAQKILNEMQVRKSTPEKRAFRAWLKEELEQAGYPVTIEGSTLAGNNVIAGDPDKAELFFTAHYDTQAVLPFPNFITPRNMLPYVLYQIIIVMGVILLGAAAEVVALLLFDPPLWVCMLIEYGVLGCFMWWLFFGKANRHTVNDNTSGVLTLLETALAMPAEDREKVCFIFFDNEERGMLGSSDFASKHKTVKKEKLILNFDCVSDGDFIQFYPTKTLKKEEETLDHLETIFGTYTAGGKEVEVVREGGHYPSDNACFKRSCGVCALKKSKRWGYYMDRIHTKKDTVLMEENILLLRDGCLALAKELAEAGK